MTKVLILGASGGIARVATDLFLNETDARLTLYLRNARKLRGIDAKRARVVEGDVLDTAKLTEAMHGQDVVYANLAGDLVPMARSVVQPMRDAGVRRLIWISSMGIYDEVPGQRYSSVLDPYRDSARVIEESDLGYTIVRPNQVMVDLVARIAAEKRATPAQLALAWLLAQRSWIVPIPGTTKLHRLEENLAGADVDLTPADLREIEAASAEITVRGARYSAAAQARIDR